MFTAAFMPFIEQRPIGVMARAILERFFEPEHLDVLFRRTAVQQYERHLLFSSVVDLMQAVVLGAEPSVFAAYRKRRHKLPVTDDALYNKLKGMELGVSEAVVNVHHMADAIERHLKARTRPKILISNERGELLDTGGGVVKALPLLGERPFFHVNSDTIWIEGVTPNLGRLAAMFDPAGMDAVMLLAATATSIGYEGRGDFSMAPDGRLSGSTRVAPRQ